MSPKNKILSNTFIIYVRYVITIFVSLYSTRIILNSLGVVDFGIFNLITGLVTMLSFLSIAMATSTQRQISFYIGNNETSQIKKIFANSVILHFIVAIIVLIIIEVIGLFFINYKLQIPIERINQTHWLFQFVVITTFITIISVPYDAVLNANEDMLFLSIMNILDSLFKLAIAYYLSYLSFNKLFSYGLLLVFSSIVIRVIKEVYIKYNFEDTKVVYRKEYDSILIKKMLKYASWNLFGTMSYIFRNQGVVILLNTFFGIIINAAYGIANQITSQVSFISITFLQAINPQIMKSEGANNREQMIKLAIIASKFSFLLILIVVPLIFEIENILALWLKKIPKDTDIICILLLISLILGQITSGIDSAIHASGNIKKYMLIVGTIKILSLPMSYIFFMFGLSYKYVFYNIILFELIGGVARIFLAKEILSLSYKFYFKNVISKVIPSVFLVLLSSILITSFYNFELRFLLTFSTSIITLLLSSYFFALNHNEKYFVNNLIKKYVKC